MPLPTKADLAWPPKALDTTIESVDLWSAWYGGDRRVLANAYGRGHLYNEPRPSIRNLFWGPRNAPAGRDTRLHIPLPADIATTSADLLFSEPPTFALPQAASASPGVVVPNPTQERLDAMVEEGGIVQRLLEGAEVASALGGVYLKLDWDTELIDQPLLEVVHQDNAVPEFRRGMLYAVTFWTTVETNGWQVLRLLERHEPGYIRLGLYQGTTTVLGQRIPLTDHEATRDLVAGLEQSEEGDAKPTGDPRLTAGYVPNMLPNKVNRGSRLGRSDYQGIEGIFDSLDETWTSWMRDIRLGRARLIVPSEYLRHQGAGQGASFDVDQEVFAPLDGMPVGEDKPAITSNQFDIRWEAHSATAKELVSLAVHTAGYSGSSFGLDSDGQAITATEARSKERRSFITRDKKVAHWTPALARILERMLALDNYLFASGNDVARPSVDFGDTVSEDPHRSAETIDLLHRAEAVSIDTKVRMAHPDWDEPRVLQEVDAIKAERGVTVADPDAFNPRGNGGGFGAGQP